MAGGFATAVAAAGHGLADGVAPSGVSLLLGLTFATVLGTLAIGSSRDASRAPSLPRLVTVVAGSQLAFHLIFAWLTPSAAPLASGPVLLHHAALPGTLAADAVAGAGAHHGWDAGMWLAHGVALVATVWFLRRAELALWELLRGAVDAARGMRLPAMAARPASGASVPADAPRHPVVLLLSGVVSRRGPPLAAAAR